MINNSYIPVKLLAQIQSMYLRTYVCIFEKRQLSHFQSRLHTAHCNYSCDYSNETTVLSVICHQNLKESMVLWSAFIMRQYISYQCAICKRDKKS